MNYKDFERVYCVLRFFDSGRLFTFKTFRLDFLFILFFFAGSSTLQHE